MLLRLSAWTKINFTYLPISTWHRSTSRIVQYLCKNGQIWTISTFVRNLLLKEKFQRSKFFISMTKKISFQLFLLNLCESLQVRPRINDLWHNTKNLFYLISVGCALVWCVDRTALCGPHPHSRLKNYPTTTISPQFILSFLSNFWTKKSLKKISRIFFSKYWKNKHEMNFIPNKHELYLINSGISGRERERERKRERER